MSLRPPSTRAAGQRPTSATSSSGSKGSDSFAFTPDQRVSIREWIDGGLAVLKAAQLQNNSNALFSLESAGPSLGVNNQNSSVGPSFLQRPRSSKGVAANNNAGASKPTPTQAAVESQFLKFQVLSASLDSLAHESAVNNEEQFEQLTIRLLVRVILCLGNYQASIRSQAVASIVHMAEILQDKVLAPGPFINQFENVDLGYAQCVSNLFKYTGSSLAVLAVPLLSGLEMYQSHTDWRVSTVATEAITQILWECRDKLQGSDKIAVVWALFFGLGAMLEQKHLIATTRLSVIHGLLQLVPIYASDAELSSSIVRELMLVSNKTLQEESAIKSTITAIFEYNFNVTSAMDGKHVLDAHYGVLLELVASQVEGAYDLLSWTVGTFFSKQRSSKPMANETTSPNPSISSSEFARALSNYFRASPALIRYGAALALNSIATTTSANGTNLPTFLSQNPNIFSYIVQGICDSDFLTAGLYTQLLEALDFGNVDGPIIRQLVTDVRQDSLRHLSYDDLFLCRVGTSPDPSNPSETRVKLMEAVAKPAPPLGLAELHKMANTLDFVDPHIKLKQLRLIRVWGRKTTKLDIYLLKILIPMCATTDPDIQLEAIKVAEKMLPSFSLAPPTEIMYIWSYVAKLLLPTNENTTLLAALQLLSFFPLAQLSDAGKEEAMSLLFSLSFHTSADIRAELYKFLGSMGNVWRTLGNTNAVLAQLLICFGDDNPRNVNIVIDHLLNLGSVAFGPVAPFLAKLRDHAKKSCFDQLRMYESFSSILLLNKLDLRPIIEGIISNSKVDEVWAFYLGGVPENQLVRPEEYNYSRNSIHNPMWAALLYSKFSVPPPPLGEGVRRDAVPSNPVGKRRFICGFMQCLLPTLGNFNPLLRKPAAIASLLCCFKGPVGGSENMKGLLEFVSQHLLPSKYATFQVSGIEVLRGICRCKIPGLSESIFTNYLELCFEFLHNSPSHIIQVAVLEFIEVFCLVFPKGVQSRLQEILDVTRPFLADRNIEVAEAASKLYPLIFKCASDESAATFESYLRKEIIMLTDAESMESLSDPLISHLNKEEALKILELNIVAMGLMLEAPSRAFENVQFLINFLNHQLAHLRLAAFYSIISLMSIMTMSEAGVVVWILLPLFADLNASIRLAWSKLRRNIPPPIHARFIALSAHPDDRTTLPLTTWEELLNDHPTIPIQLKALADLTYTIDELEAPPQNDMPIEDDGFHLPTISEKLIARFKQLVGSMTEPQQLSNQGLVLYQLEQYRDNPSLVPSMNLALSEFACLHDDVFEETAAVLIAQLAVEMNAAQAPSIESSIGGIRNILVHSRTMFKPIIDRLVEQQFVAEGEMLVMVHVLDMFVNLPPSTTFELISKFCFIGSNTKHSDEKRILALYLASEFAFMVGPESVKPVLDALQLYLEGQPANADREKLYRIAGRLFPISGEKHLLFKSMMSYARKLIKSNVSSNRSQALSIIRIFAPTMQSEECLSFIFKFLADPDKGVRESARNAILDDQLMSKNWGVLKGIPVDTPEREALMSSGKLPCMDFIGMSAVSKSAETTNQATETMGATVIKGANSIDDPLNINYFKSDQRKKFTKHYKLDEGKFAKCIEPATIGILKSIENKINGVSVNSDATQDYQTLPLREMQPFVMLRAWIPLSPTVAESIVLDLLRSIEIFIDPERLNEADDESKDLESAIHKIDVLANFMIAYGATRLDLTTIWLDRIQKFISSAMLLCHKIRNSLYADLEKSFYYRNQFADIPLISDEQYQVLQELREVTQEAILDIVKSGKTEKVKLIDNRNDQWDDEVDSQSDYLRTLNGVSLQMLSGYGIYVILTKELPEQVLCDAFKFIISQLEEEHRGIRYLAVESAVELILRQESLSTKSALLQLVKDTISDTVTRLQNESSNLYRKKTDFIYLAAQLIHLHDDTSLQNTLLKLLVSFWRDGDSEVRHFAVDLIPILAGRGVKPVIDAFKDKTLRSSPTSVDLVQELVVLGNNPDYPDKHLLQNLLRWRFSSNVAIW